MDQPTQELHLAGGVHRVVVVRPPGVWTRLSRSTWRRAAGGKEQ
jgi:hypothetical protein